MAKDDNTFQPVVFTRTNEKGETKELTANSPADVVKLTFEGWKAKKSGAARNTPAAGTAGTANKP